MRLRARCSASSGSIATRLAIALNTIDQNRRGSVPVLHERSPTPRRAARPGAMGQAPKNRGRFRAIAFAAPGALQRAPREGRIDVDERRRQRQQVPLVVLFRGCAGEKRGHASASRSLARGVDVERHRLVSLIALSVEHSHALAGELAGERWIPRPTPLATAASSGADPRRRASEISRWIWWVDCGDVAGGP